MSGILIIKQSYEMHNTDDLH